MDEIKSHKVSFFERFKRSIVDIRSYNFFVKESLGKGILYLFLLSLMVAFITSSVMSYKFKNSFEDEARGIMIQMPDFEFKNGEMNVEGDMPLRIDDYIIVDTTGNTDASVLDSYNEGILILKDKAVVKKNVVEKREFDFSSINDVEFNKQDVAKYIPKINNWISIFIVLFGMIFGTLWIMLSTMINALILGIAGIIISKVQKMDIEFGYIYKICIYAFTLSIVVDKLIIGYMPIYIPYFNIVYYIVAGIYMYNAMDSYRREIQQ
ncbi:DUF1189 domain-containing protein [Tepidibacter hydrothermalis]|uniref:DUF1189 domain-containing protein n=1 Tax=Tepidibacter hydrothermalis TaxID=3036126 RepID=A0ABY8EDD7_9FIRM|nr:DUF1189 domain-containing protein [Tepidibacter hydrothermalis]WFD09507.1 DUF1189 domain-containing protein [Tepidibacter hydrothermalis]